MKRSNRSGPARRGLPGDRRLRRHLLLVQGGGDGRTRTPTRRRPSCRPSSRPQDIPLGTRDPGRPGRRPRSCRRRRATPTPSATSRQVIGQIVRQPVTAGAADHRRRPSSGGQQGRSSTSDCPPACAAWRSRSTRSPASARSSRPATTSTWSSASPATSSRSSPINPDDDSFTVVARPQRHERQAAPPGHAGPRARCCRRRRAQPTAERPARGDAGHRPSAASRRS